MGLAQVRSFSLLLLYLTQASTTSEVSPAKEEHGGHRRRDEAFRGGRTGRGENSGNPSAD